MMTRRNRWSFTLITAIYLLPLACASGLKTTRFTNPAFDFAFVERVAVLPLENLSNEKQAGARATRMLITDLLSTGAVDVVEPGDVRTALSRLQGIQMTAPSGEHIKALGAALQVQAIIIGSVTQSESLRSGTVLIPVVTIDLHMLETETAAAVWAATHTEKGAGLSAKLLGTGAEPISQTTRRCIRELIKTLVR
jgi:TolB-like protein